MAFTFLLNTLYRILNTLNVRLCICHVTSVFTYVTSYKLRHVILLAARALSFSIKLIQSLPVHRCYFWSRGISSLSTKIPPLKEIKLWTRGQTYLYLWHLHILRVKNLFSIDHWKFQRLFLPVFLFLSLSPSRGFFSPSNHRNLKICYPEDSASTFYRKYITL